MGNSKAAQENIEIVLGAALLVGAAAMVLRYVLDRHVRGRGSQGAQRTMWEIRGNEG